MNSKMIMVDSDDNAVSDYYALRAAQHHFQKLPEELSEEQQQWLSATVARQQQMEARVLSSMEAAAVVVADGQLKQAMDELQAQYDDADAFLDDLQRLGLSVSQLSDLLERQLRVELVLERHSAAVTPASAEDARAYYDAHPDKFRTPERRQAWHLLITLNDEFVENSRAEVTRRLEKIRAEAAGDLALFRKRAKRYSECPSALSDGEMGWLPAGQLFPQIDRALFSLASGEITPVVETDVGLHLVYCSGIQPEAMLPFEQVADKIGAKLTEAKQQQAQRDWLRSLS